MQLPATAAALVPREATNFRLPRKREGRGRDVSCLPHFTGGWALPHPFVIVENLKTFACVYLKCLTLSKEFWPDVDEAFFLTIGLTCAAACLRY